VGFFVDASILTVLTTRMGFGLLAGRCVSFTAATLTTWLLNRIIVFSVADGRRAEPLAEYGRYLSVQVAGAATNLAMFFALIVLQPRLANAPVLPLAAGAACALLITYFGSRRFVFLDHADTAQNHDRH
jgi:putative flippase GtrA